jgi:hypothetical protein
MEKAAASAAIATEAAAEPKPEKTESHHAEGAGAAAGGLAAIGGFLKSREGKAITKQVARGVFGMLKK